MRLSRSKSRVSFNTDKFSENDCAALTFYEKGTRFFVKVKIANRELDALVDSDSTKYILGKTGIKLATEFLQKPLKFKLFYSRTVALSRF